MQRRTVQAEPHGTYSRAGAQPLFGFLWCAAELGFLAVRWGGGHITELQRPG